MVNVTVSDPQTDGEGRNKHTSYRVEVSAGGAAGKSVRRRYSDFQWLYNRLHAERPGAVIPIIPHKRAVTQATRFSEELVAERRVQLEVFLQRVIAHPELVEAPSVAAFCRAGGDTFETAKKELEATLPNPTDYASQTEAREAETPNKIRNLIARTTVAATVMSGNTELQKTDDEPEIEEVARYVEGLDSNVRSFEKQATALVKIVKDNANTMEELSQSFHGWALTHQAHYCPSGSDSTVVMLNKISSSARGLATIQLERSRQETANFEESVSDLARTVQAIKLALQRRKERQLTYTTRVKQIAGRKANLEKLRGKPGKENKIDQAEADVQQAERAADAAREELDAVSKRVLREVERMKKELDEHIRKTMLQYTESQIEFSKRSEEAWSKLAPNLGGTGSGATGTQDTPQPSAPPPPPPGEEGGEGGATEQFV